MGDTLPITPGDRAVIEAARRGFSTSVAEPRRARRRLGGLRRRDAALPPPGGRATGKRAAFRL